MRTRRLASMLALLLLVGCSKPMSMEEYFTQLEQINKAASDAWHDAQVEAEEAFAAAATDEEVSNAYITYLAALAAAGEHALSSTENLTPPSELEEAHQALAEARGETVDGARGVLLEVEAADPHEVQSIVEKWGSKTIEADLTAWAACQDLQEAANENNILVSLCDNQAAYKAARTSARNGLAAAKTLFTETNDYSQISRRALAEIAPSWKWVDSPEASTNWKTISVWSDGSMAYASATLSDPGTCFWVKDDATQGTSYGIGDAATCTGEDAAAAADAEW